jgi:hypothetical protein
VLLLRQHLALDAGVAGVQCCPDFLILELEVHGAFIMPPLITG